jgi:hypothetical protein
VIVTFPVRASIAGVKVISIAQISPASRLPTAAGRRKFCGRVRCHRHHRYLNRAVVGHRDRRVALATPTACVLKTIDGALRMMLGVVTVAAVPESVMLGFVAALDWTVKVAVREPAFSGLSNVSADRACRAGVHRH